MHSTKGVRSHRTVSSYEGGLLRVTGYSAVTSDTPCARLKTEDSATRGYNSGVLSLQ